MNAWTAYGLCRWVLSEDLTARDGAERLLLDLVEGYRSDDCVGSVRDKLFRLRIARPSCRPCIGPTESDVARHRLDSWLPKSADGNQRLAHPGVHRPLLAVRVVQHRFVNQAQQFNSALIQ